MVDLKDTELTPMTKAEYRAWEDYVRKYNEDNPKDQICYEVRWKDDIYNVEIINLGVDRKD